MNQQPVKPETLQIMAVETARYIPVDLVNPSHARGLGKWLAVILWIIICTVICTSCSILYVQQQHDELSSDHRLVGRIIGSTSQPQRQRVILWREHQQRLSIEGFATPNKQGIFAFLVRPNDGEFGLWVHDDVNGNALFDSEEPQWLEPVSEYLSETTFVDNILEIDLQTGAPDDSRVAALELELLGDADSTQAGSAIPIGFGDVVSFDTDQRLATSTGISGLWRPATVVRNTGLGIYFLQQYDAARKPLLLVHGAGGSAQDFRQLIENLDDEYWQYWVYIYPSGIRLQSAAEALARIVKGLHENYQTAPVSVVAHSMGGLVTRAALQQLRDIDSDAVIDRLVTISTPWQGHPAARYGVEHAPISLPSWLDMLPESDFIKAVVANPPPPPHLVIFGEKSRKKFYLPTRNDGTIGVESASYQPIIDQAAAVSDYPLGHVEILHSQDVSERIAKFLVPQ